MSPLPYSSAAPMNQLLHRCFAHALSHSRLPIALAGDHTGVHPAALRSGQGIERNAQMAEQLHALQQLLRGGFRNAGGIFDPVLTVEGILRLVADDPPLIGDLL